MLRELDWDTSPNRIKIADHWRLLLCVALSSVAATLIWHAFFPHTFWFIKLWTGFATGATVGMIPGTWWQLSDDKRRPITSGCFVVIGIFGWGFSAGISMFLLLPDLNAQERELATIRSLSVADISSLVIRVDGRRSRRIDRPDSIASFVANSRRAELFYPSHEGSTIEFEMTVYRKDAPPLQYKGHVPQRHQSDMSLRFRGYFVWTEIIVPEDRHWIDMVIREDAK